MVLNKAISNVNAVTAPVVIDTSAVRQIGTTASIFPTPKPSPAPVYNPKNDRFLDAEELATINPKSQWLKTLEQSAPKNTISNGTILKYGLIALVAYFIFKPKKRSKKWM